ncbi:cellulose synthase operon protein YhjQ [Pseudomonas asplenii]|uniref:Cellulose synthase operon protein YhjQ n=2 Tax=Pseudomonas asplenii TaxID=53407 RepID=A0A0N0E5X6_9PSED|nr:cellulose biosynthesis protein BcsQ [Pseudomonas fuscovaginae]KPA93002.1 cellulose synthase operon protein YhjQ [Pseudomonas fuscovaginae]
MHRSDDIANLFKRFGGSAESYLEIEPSYDYAEETASQLIAALDTLQPVAPVTPIRPSLPVPDETQGATPVAADDVPSADPVPAPAVPPAAVAAPIPVAAAAAATATSLSRLLAEIEQQRQASATHAPAQAGGQPVLKAKVIAVVSAKGGVGKSTLAAALASAIKRADGRTLALDLDPQNALCLHLGGNDQWPGVAQDYQQQDWRRVLRDGFSACHCLAYGLVSEEERVNFESGLRADPTWLARHLAELGLGEQDTVIIDTPSGATAYLAQALAIADVAVVVTLADAASYASLEQMNRLLAPYRQRQIPLQCRYVINQLDTSRQFSLDVCEVLKRKADKQLLGVIRQDHCLGEALAYERNPLAHIPTTRGCQDILDVAGSLCELLVQGTQESHLS